jgi:alcohol dehydrogenase
MAKVLAHELEIIGSHGIQAFKYQEMFSFIRQNEIALESYISERVDLETAGELLPVLDQNKTPGTTLITSF